MTTANLEEVMDEPELLQSLEVSISKYSIPILFTFYLKVTQAGIENANLLLLPFPLEHN